MRNRIPRVPGRYRAIVLSLLVHAAIVGILVIGFNWTTTPTAVPPPTIQATIAEDPEKRKLEEDRRRAEEARRREEAEQRQQAEAERKRKEAEEAKRREEEQKRKEEERRLEDKRKKAEAEKQKQEEAKRKQEEARKEADRKRQEADAKKKREESESRRKAAEESLKQQLEEEERLRVESAKAARAQTELQKYQAIIQRKVRENWTAVGTAPGLQCLVRVRLAPGGEVLQATVVKGSGNPVFDRSVPPAVYKASPLPIPSDPQLFEYFREIDFLFKP